MIMIGFPLENYSKLIEMNKLSKQIEDFYFEESKC